ncbi:MAG: hypothetical protein QXO78_01745 [Desulfurococcaceae archaeon]
MSLKLDWKRTFPEDCIITGFKHESESIFFNLYCSSNELDVAVNVNNGRLTIKEQREPGLLGTFEFREHLFIATCYQGLGNRLWYRTCRGVITRFHCQQNLCILATLSKDRVLEASILDKNGETLETMKYNNVLDFTIGSSRDILALSISGLDIDYSRSILIDLSTMNIVDEIEKFGGQIVSTMDHVAVYGFKEYGLTHTKFFDKRGEEVLEIEGIPYFPPYNPLPIPIHERLKFPTNIIVVGDKHNVKIINPRDYSIIFAYTKMPFTKGIFDVDLEENTLISLLNLMGKPVLIKHDIRGVVDWVSHIMREVSYLVSSRNLVALNTRIFGGETRIYRVMDRKLIHIDSFGSNTIPIVINEDSVILTNGRLVTRYIVE